MQRFAEFPARDEEPPRFSHFTFTLRDLGDHYLLVVDKLLEGGGVVELVALTLDRADCQTLADLFDRPV